MSSIENSKFSQKNEAFAFKPLYSRKGRAERLIFRKHANGEIWKSELQRDKLFAAIWEHDKALTKKIVVDIKAITPDGCIYSYNSEGKQIYKTISTSEKFDENLYKVHKLSLREFKKVQTTGQIVSFLKSAVDLLFSPLSYLYHVFARKSDSQKFAAMLSRPEHDQVGEINHDAVLSQMKFISDFLAQEEQDTYKNLNLGLEDEKLEHKEKEKFLNIGLRDKQNMPFEKKGDIYRIFVGEFAPNDRNQIYRNVKANKVVKPLALYFPVKNANNAEGTSSKELQERFEKYDTQNITIDDQQYLKVTFGKQKVGEDKDKNPVWDSRAEWIEVPATAKVYTDRDSYSPCLKELKKCNTDDLQAKEEFKNEAEQLEFKRFQSSLEGKIPIFSGIQNMASLFAESYRIGTEMRDLLLSGNSKKKNQFIKKLAQRMEALFNPLNFEEHNSLPHLILPLAQGEGKDYMPHFLVFTSEYYANGSFKRLLLKHVCLSSTSLDVNKIHVSTTYDVSQSLRTLKGSENLIRSLLAMQAYSRKKDQLEKNLKGPVKQDNSLKDFLTEFGNVVGEEKSSLMKASRDPVKALLTIMKELDVEDARISSHEHKLKEITESKARFYQYYVDHLVSYYEANESRLSASEQKRSLEGILWYAEKLRHYWEKETDVKTALAISQNLIDFVEQKIDAFKLTEKKEKEDIKNLESKASIFKAKLAYDIGVVFNRRDRLTQEDISFAKFEDLRKLLDLKDQLETTDWSKLPAETAPVVRKNIETAFEGLLNSGRSYLKSGNLIGARTLLITLMQALPTGKAREENTDSFWDTLDKEEISQWTGLLDRLAEQMFEACLRSGTFPLEPHAAFDFNVTLPLLQRYLFQRNIPLKEQEFQETLRNNAANANIKDELQIKKDKFITLRENQIEEEVDKELKDKWKKEDADDKKRWESYVIMKKVYAAEMKKWNEFIANPGNFSLVSVPSKPGNPPAVPTIKTSEQKKEDRKSERNFELEMRKEDDAFLQDLNAIDVNSIDKDWDVHFAKSQRMRAVMGAFAKILGLSKSLCSYHIEQEDWIAATFQENTVQAYNLMEYDVSLMLGASPLIEKRYLGNLETFKVLKKLGSVLADSAAYFTIGYDGLGKDGTKFENDKDLSDLSDKLSIRQQGFFNVVPESESAMIVPKEMSYLRRVEEMRKILRNPEKYLSPHHEGMLGRVYGALMDEEVSLKAFQKTCSSMSSIYLVASEKQKCFTISSSKTKVGTLGTNDKKESPPDTIERKNYIGQISVEIAAAKVKGREETETIDRLGEKKLYPSLDQFEEFVLRLSSLSNDSEVGDRLSYLSISQCMHFIYQYPLKITIPEVRHTLYKTFFQEGLIRKQLANNPEFFVRFGPILNEICTFLGGQGEDHRVSEVFLREVSERIRLHAKDIFGKENSDWVKKISDALPKYDKETVIGLFLQKSDTEYQKAFATYALSYYSRNIPSLSLDEIASWRNIFEAFYTMQHSKLEMGHTGMQAELSHVMKSVMLPKIFEALKTNPDLRNQLLNRIVDASNASNNWEVDNSQDFSFTHPTSNGKPFTLNLLTGKGFKDFVIKGGQTRIPEQIRLDEKFQFLFDAEYNPLVTSINTSTNGVIEYNWVDEKTGVEFNILHQPEFHLYQINQVHQEKKYKFEQLKLSTAMGNQIWNLLLTNHGNKTIEKMIENKGVWIPIKENGKQELSKVMLAQHGWSLEKDPITLHIKKNKILAASLGKGKEQRFICSGLASKHAQLLSFRSGEDLLLLTKDRKHIDEIRFPVDPRTNEQLILKKCEEDPSIWVVGGKEEWQWQLQNTKHLEKRFGTNWREYILPLKNRKTGEEEIWIVPHIVVSGSKYNSNLKFIKSLVDVLEICGASLKQLNSSGLDFDELRMLLGGVENFMGGAMGVAALVEKLMSHVENQDRAAAKRLEKLLELLKDILAPQLIQYKIGNRQESSSHAGFLYLAHVASLNRDWGAATRYLNLFDESGSSASKEDLKQLSKLIAVIFVLNDIFRDNSDNPIEGMMAPKKPLEAAFRAKIAISLIRLQSRLKAQHQTSIYPKDLLQLFDENDSLDEEDDLTKESQFESGFETLSNKLYLDYVRGGREVYQQLKDNNLLLSEEEVKILTKKPELSTLILENEKLERKQALDTHHYIPKPISFEIPTEAELKQLAAAISEFSQPYGVWSIHQLHKKEGSYPKWETVLANFWSYWQWILNNDLKIEDIAFLLRDIPNDAANFVNLNIAKRTLLCFWHYMKDPQYTSYHNQQFLAEQALLREVLERRADMPDLASLERAKKRFKNKAIIEPGISNSLKAKFYSVYSQARQKLSTVTYTEKRAGTQLKRGIHHDFVKTQEELFTKFVSPVFDEMKQKGLVILPTTIAQPIARSSVNSGDIKPRIYLNEEKFDAIVKIISLISDEDPNDLSLELQELLNKKPEDSEHKGSSGDLQDYVEIISEFLEIDFETGFNLWLHQGDFKIQYSDRIAKSKEVIRMIHDEYSKKRCLPKVVLPQKINKADYEAVEVHPAAEMPDWESSFNQVDSRATWEGRKKLAQAKFNPQNFNSERDKYKLQNIWDGIEVAAEEMIQKTDHSFAVKSLKPTYENIQKKINCLAKESDGLRSRILEFAFDHSDELETTYLFAKPGRFTDEQVLQVMLDLYRYGKLGLLNDLALQQFFAKLITEYLLVTTEMQQYEKAQEICLKLNKECKKLNSKIPSAFKGNERLMVLQKVADKSVDWLLHSVDIYTHLTQGANRLRYAEKIGEKYYLKDQKFNRRYLVSDVRNRWISRENAINALENMLKDIAESKNKGEPIRFIRAAMGTGKSDFIFPEAIDLLIQEKYDPIMITTDELIPQLQASMGDKSFVFKFDIHFGIEEGASEQKIKRHLKDLNTTLENLHLEKKSVLTSPSQRANLHDKRVELQGKLASLTSEAERVIVFKQLELLKKIELHFTKSNTIHLIDEDVNYDISYEYNYATGDFRTVDPIRFEMAEKIFRTIEEKHPELWDLFCSNNLRSITDVGVTFAPVVESLFEDISFWTSIGWKEEVWQSISKREFVDYILGKREQLPINMPPIDESVEIKKQQEKCYVASLKTFMARTFDSVKGVHPKLERGLSSRDGVTVAPKSDGNEKVGVLYGEESENILHHMLHYVGVGNQIGEALFLEKIKDLDGIHLRISPHYPETWHNWASQIGEVYKEKGYPSRYDAFVKAPELARHRIQYLRYLMLETTFIRVYNKQITFNSQDLGIDADARVASGTGSAPALNLSHYLKPETYKYADNVFGKTVLCFDLDQTTTTFDGKKPFEFMMLAAKDPNCSAILNYDYEVMAGDSERLAGSLRSKGVKRQIIYRNRENAKKIWNSGEHFFPMGYEPSSIDPKNAFFYYGRKDSRGVHFHVPRDGEKYGFAMVGAGNQQDAIAQLLWRFRHLGFGHKIRMAHDENTARQIRIANKLDEKQQPTIGDAMLYFTLNTIEEEDLKNVKATMFKSGIALKTAVEKVAREPYHPTATEKDDDHLLQLFEGSIIFECVKDLYILSSEINWLQEYQPQKMTKPTDFVEQLYKIQLKKIDQLEKKIKIKMQENFNAHIDLKQVENVDLKELERFSSSDNLRLHLSLFIKDDVICEIILKYLILVRGFKEAKETLNKEIALLNSNGKENESYKAYLESILPNKISIDLEGGARSEQKVEQLQEQKVEQVQVQVERQFNPTYSNLASDPIDFKKYKDVVLGRRKQSNPLSSIRFALPWGGINGNFLSTQCAFHGDEKFSVKLPDCFNNTYISQRAFYLLKKMGKAGAPAFDIAMIQVENTFHSVIITPTEREENVAGFLKEERNIAADKKNHLNKLQKLSEKSEQEEKWNEPLKIEVWEDFKFNMKKLLMKTIRAQIGWLYPFASGTIEQKLNQIFEDKSLQETALEHIYTLLEKDSEEDIDINDLIDNVKKRFPAEVVQHGMKINIHDYINAAKSDVKNEMKKLHQKYSSRLNSDSQSITTKDTDKITVYALSNEKFSRMILDCVNPVDEIEKNFLHTMVMNKLLLNWEKYTLEELDYLHNRYAITKNALEYAELSFALSRIDAAQSQEILRSIRYEEDEWSKQIALRKLAANYKEGQYHRNELAMLEKWIKETATSQAGLEIEMNKCGKDSISANLLRKLHNKNSNRKVATEKEGKQEKP